MRAHEPTSPKCVSGHSEHFSKNCQNKLKIFSKTELSLGKGSASMRAHEPTSPKCVSDHSEHFSKNCQKCSKNILRYFVTEEWELC